MGWKKKVRTAAGVATSRLNDALYTLGPALRRAVQWVLRAFRGLFIAVGLILVVALSAAWAGTLIGAFAIMPVISFLAPIVSWLPPIAFISLLVCIGVPLFFLVMWLLRIMFDTRIHGGLAAALIMAWIFSIAGLVSSGWLMTREFRDEVRVRLKEASVAPVADTIDIELQAWPPAGEHLLALQVDEAVHYHDGDLYLGFVSVSVMPSPDDTLRVVVEAEARGSHNAAARTNALHIDYPLQLRPDAVRLSPWYRLEQGEQWRAQQVRVIVYVPAGKYIRLLPSDTQMDISLFLPERPARALWPQRRPQVFQMAAPAATPQTGIETVRQSDGVRSEE